MLVEIDMLYHRIRGKKILFHTYFSVIIYDWKPNRRKKKKDLISYFLSAKVFTKLK